MPEERVALITGATGGLGKSVATTFVKNGVNVAVSYRHEESLERLLESLGPQREAVFSVKADTGDETQVNELLAQVLAKFGRLDMLINLVGGWKGGQTIAETSEATWDFMMNINLKSVFLCSKAAFPHLIRQPSSSIVNISSRAAIQVTAGNGPYAVSKRAVIALAETLAEEGKEHGLRANALLPTVIDTEANRQAMPQADFSTWVKPSEIAGVAYSLTSHEAKAVSGAAIPLYGRA